MKEGVTIILAEVLLLPPAPSRGDTVCHCERETTLFRLTKEDTTRNQWLSWSVCSAFYGGLFPDPGRVAYNVKSIKWGNSNVARTVWCF